MCPTAPDLSYLTDCIAFSLLLPPAAVPVAALDGEMSPGLTVACLGVRLVERPLCLGEEVTRRHGPVRAWEGRAVDAVVGEDHEFPPARIAGPQQRGHDLRCHASSPARAFPVEPGAFRMADVADLHAVDPGPVAEQVLVQGRLRPAVVDAQRDPQVVAADLVEQRHEAG